MSDELDWLSAFPIRPASEAVEALCESWRRLAAQQRPGFHPGKSEPHLTRVLKNHVENVTSRERGLLGMWATEAVLNTIDPETAEITEERRSDIVYGWNNETTGIQLVFEFKKLNQQARSRNSYLGEKGLARFVTGIYGRQQSVAAMVGVLVAPKEVVVPSLCKALGKPPAVAALRLRLRPSGAAFDSPSALFKGAEFDTEHERDPDLAPCHGTIRVSHFFLAFGYTSPKERRSPRRQRAMAPP